MDERERGGVVGGGVCGWTDGWNGGLRICCGIGLVKKKKNSSGAH